MHRGRGRENERELADRYWNGGVFTRISEVDLKAIKEAFAERVLTQLHKRELITDDKVAQILSQDHTGYGVQVAFIQDEPSIKNIMKSQGIPDFFPTSPWCTRASTSSYENCSNPYLTALRFSG